MGLLDSLLANPSQQQDYQDFVGRYQQGQPHEGYTDQEVVQRYQQVAPNLSADQQAPPQKVKTTPNHTKLGDQGLALLEAQILNIARQELIGPHPTAAQRAALKATELRMDALTTLIKAQIAHGAKSGDAAHGFRGSG
jgi:hypothetical protein